MSSIGNEGGGVKSRELKVYKVPLNIMGKMADKMADLLLTNQQLLANQQLDTIMKQLGLISEQLEFLIEIVDEHGKKN